MLCGYGIRKVHKEGKKKEYLTAVCHVNARSDPRNNASSVVIEEV